MDELDRILSNETVISPSERFTLEVMEAIDAETVAPRALRFPWPRAVGGIVAAALVVGAVIAAQPLMPSPPEGGALNGGVLGGILALGGRALTKVGEPIVVTFLISFVSIRLSSRAVG